MNADAPQEVRGDEDQPPVDAVDVDAGDGREEDRRHEEGQDQQADRGVRAGRLDDDDGQPEQDHVAADLGRRLRQPETEEAGVPEDRERAGFLGRLRGCDGLRHVDDPSGPGAAGVAIAAVIAGSPRETNPASRRFEDAALEQDVPAAGLAAEADVGAQAIDEPGVAAARVGASKPDDVAEEQREDGLVWHRRVRVSKARVPVGRDEGAGRGRQLEPVDRCDRDDDASAGSRPAGR